MDWGFEEPEAVLGCRATSDAVLLPEELEEGFEDGQVLPPAEPPAEPTIGLKELTEQIQVVMQCLDETAQAAAELLLERTQELSTATVNFQDEPTSFNSQLTPMQQLLEQTAESSPQATPSPAPPLPDTFARFTCDSVVWNYM
ncbi:hypothetical protein DUI87_03180 [Hirundo rustica rustica]|uniref:Uncharacterized protein n=1 Tax=Hirundo rustica rustica TaxID=333673 RepID=A0A3M0L9D9_HIRRU|nr:hypothetical protein DUI87_03180 [Hirundo rustica rustica]